jgi:hypothetical protein
MRCELGGTILLFRDSLEVTWMMDELRLNSVQKNKGIIKPPYVRKPIVKMCQQRGNSVDRGVARGQPRLRTSWSSRGNFGRC